MGLTELRPGLESSATACKGKGACLAVSTKDSNNGVLQKEHGFTYFRLKAPQTAEKQVRNACTLWIPTSGPTLWAPPVASTKSLAANNATQIQESVTERLSARLGTTC